MVGVPRVTLRLTIWRSGRGGKNCTVITLRKNQIEFVVFCGVILRSYDIYFALFKVWLF